MKKDPSSTPSPARKTRKPKAAQPLVAPIAAPKRSAAAPRLRAKADPASSEQPGSTKKTKTAAVPEALDTVPRRMPANPELVAERAYFLFAARNWEHGHDLDDWLQAEAELMAHV